MAARSKPSLIPQKATRLCDNAPYCKEPGSAGVHFFNGKLYCKTCRLGEQSKIHHAEWLTAGCPPAEESIANIRRLLNTPRDPRAWMKNPKSALAERYAAEVRNPVKKVPVRIPGEDDA